MPTQQRFSLSARDRSGFSLVEMIGVLAIIAILAVIIVPKVFSTIASSRVTSAASSVNSIKTAIADFGGKYGSVPLSTVNGRIDDLLVTAGILESRFVVKIGTQPVSPIVAGATWTNAAGTWSAAGGASQATQSKIISLNSTAAVPSVGVGADYYLDGANPLPVGSRVVSAVIMGCTGAEAFDLSQKIDGPALSAANAAAVDNLGKVVYAAPNAAGLTNVYIYLAHQ